MLKVHGIRTSELIHGAGEYILRTSHVGLEVNLVVYPEGDGVVSFFDSHDSKIHSQPLSSNDRVVAFDIKAGEHHTGGSLLFVYELDVDVD